jgi:hypothetical protein
MPVWAITTHHSVNPGSGMFSECHSPVKCHRRQLVLDRFQSLPGFPLQNVFYLNNHLPFIDQLIPIRQPREKRKALSLPPDINQFVCGIL